MIPLLNGEELDVDLRRTRMMLEDSDIDTSGYSGSGFKAEDLPAKRAFLSCLVQELQWSHAAERLESYYKTQIRSRTSRIFILAFILYFLPDLFPNLADLVGFSEGSLKYFTHAAIFAGALGGCFSMMSKLERRLEAATLDHLRAMFSYRSVVSRALLGMVGGLLVFYIIRSGALAGSFFPNLADIEGAKLDLSLKERAMLIIWCFIGGFSENLVPNVLTKTAEKEGAAKTAD